MFKQSLVWAKLALLAIMAVTICRGGAATTVSAQSGDPSLLPLLSSGDMQYLGGFRLPRATVNGDNFEFGGRPLAFNPSGPSLFVSSRNNRLAEVSIPTPVNSSDVNAMPFASYLQGFSDPTEGRLGEIGYDGLALGALVVQNNRLYGTGWVYFDAVNGQRMSHYSRSLQLNQSSFVGWSSVWDAAKTGYVSGYMANIPAEWQGKLGGPTLTGQCCVPIVSRTSFGPDAFAFDASKIGQALVPASPLLYYTGDHATLGPWEGSNEWYGMSTGMGGVAVIAGTRTALFVGRNGVGPACYGTGTATQSLVGTAVGDGSIYCYDPTNNYKAVHAYPYRYQVWAYDLNDFAAVKAGSKQPWDVVPYGVWPIEFPIAQQDVSIGGVSYDAQRQLLYVSQLLADPDGNRPLIHVFQLNAPRSDGSLPPAPAPVAAPATVTSVALSANRAAPQPPMTAITWTATPAGGVAPYQYKFRVFDGAVWTTAAGWSATNSFTWTPATANANYRVEVWVRSAGNTADVAEASSASAFAIQAVTSAGTTPVSSVQIYVNKLEPQQTGTSLTWNAVTTGGATPLSYKWFVDNGSGYVVAADWNASTNFAWTPTTAASYRIRVWVKSAGNSADQPEASTEKGFNITAPQGTTTTPTGSSPVPPVSQVMMTADKASPLSSGTTVTFTSMAFNGVGPYQFRWWVFDGKQWTAATNWSTSNKFSWTPTSPDPKYQVAVWARSAGSTVDGGEATASMPFNVNNGKGNGKD